MFLGSYCEEQGLTEPSGLCAPGFYCPDGSVSNSSVVCPEGRYCPLGETLYWCACIMETTRYTANWWLCLCYIRCYIHLPGVLFRGSEKCFVCLFFHWKISILADLICHVVSSDQACNEPQSFNYLMVVYYSKNSPPSLSVCLSRNPHAVPLS